MKGRAITYSADELAWLEAHRTLPLSEYLCRFLEHFPGRTGLSEANLSALRKRKGWKTGRTGQFEPGQESWNKGKRMPSHPNSRKTQFRKGERRGVAVRLYKPIGTERLTREGYVERKIHDGMPLQSRWRAVHLIRWEEKNGALPAGHCLKCLDGKRANTDPGNWLAIPRALLPRLNGGPHKTHLAFDQAEPELKPALLSIARLDRAARDAQAGEAPPAGIDVPPQMECVR